MALIKCPDCGRDVSDKAKSCPFCGCPVVTPSGTVQIRVNPLKSGTGLNGRQKVTIYSGNKEIWEGNVGETAEIYFDGPTSVTVKYHLSALQYAGQCSGTIEPEKSKKYVVSARQGLLSTKIILQAVDVFDAD